MGRIQCPECAQQISGQAEACPHCGHPILAVPTDSEFLAHRKRAQLHSLLLSCMVGIFAGGALDLKGVAILSFVGMAVVAFKLRRLRTP